jgi:endoglucanase
VKFNAGSGSYNSGSARAVRIGVMRNMTSMQLTGLMSPGWNLGNTLEAMPNETGWGNPMANQAMFNGLKSAGFKSVRIPVSWKQYADANDNISASWMSRVTEVVNYAHNAGLIAIINIHWDGGWMQPTYANQSAANARLTKFWTQIANNFKNHDDTLLFAGTNEVMVDGNYNPPTTEYCSVQKGFNQTFINAVRATGGNNSNRHLVVQAFNTNIDHALSCNATMPHFVEVGPGCQSWRLGQRVLGRRPVPEDEDQLHRQGRSGDPGRVRRHLAHRVRRGGRLPQILGPVRDPGRLHPRRGADVLG